MADEVINIEDANQKDVLKAEENDSSDHGQEITQSSNVELAADNTPKNEEVNDVDDTPALAADDGPVEEDNKDIDNPSKVEENVEQNEMVNTEENAESVPVIEESNAEGQTSDNNEANENFDSEAKPMPINDAIPEEEEPSPEIEISHSVSHEPPYETQDDTLNDKEIPDAYSTPPPPENQEIDQEDEISHDFYEKMKEHSDGDSTPEFTIYDRNHLLDRYKEALEERSQLQNMNNQLQHKLAEYFKKKKTDERVQEVEKNVTDQEQRYLKYISNLEELQNEEKRQQEEIKSQIEDLKVKCQDKQEKVDVASDEYMKFKFDVAKSSINSRSGKQLPIKDLEQFQVNELKKEQEVVQVRLENIKLKNRLRKKEQQLKAKEELAEGLHLIDFEQLKIENQTYNEKIEERNEEILKLRKKITTTVQVLTHLKEKLQFVQGENSEQRTGLRQIDATVAQKRDILTRTKQVRDALRIENVKLKQKCGLLGNESLLRDFEYRKDEGDDLRNKLDTLRTDHVSLSMNLNGLKKKIRQSRNHSA